MKLWKGVWSHAVKHVSCQPDILNDWAESDVRNIGTVGQTDSPDTWSHPYLPVVDILSIQRTVLL